MIKCIIFDLDGVLCDLVQVHRKALDLALLSTCGYTIKEDEFWRYYNGIPSNVKLNMLVNRGILDPKDKDRVWNLKQDNTIHAIKECLFEDKQKIELHRFLKSEKYNLICVSNSIRNTIELALKQTGQLEFMDFFLGNEDFGIKPKPDPYCYNYAMNKIKLNKEECLIIEDSEKGITAAIKSGAFVLEVENPSKVTIENIIRKIKDANNR
jgi:beta-phosphoglucomutase-like phosphatase (HAD superfamily)